VNPTRSEAIATAGRLLAQARADQAAQPTRGRRSRMAARRAQPPRPRRQYPRRTQPATCLADVPRDPKEGRLERGRQREREGRAGSGSRLRRALERRAEVDARKLEREQAIHRDFYEAASPSFSPRRSWPRSWRGCSPGRRATRSTPTSTAAACPRRPSQGGPAPHSAGRHCRLAFEVRSGCSLARRARSSSRSRWAWSRSARAVWRSV
jgi:hypothetical protein